MRTIKVVCLTVVVFCLTQYQIVKKAGADVKIRQECNDVKVVKYIFDDTHTIPFAFCDGTFPYDYELEFGDEKVRDVIDKVEKEIKNQTKKRPSFFYKIRSWFNN